ncbi:MAG: hypothetical protein OHK0012_12950 [Synechococcales cyanobacterium]
MAPMPLDPIATALLDPLQLPMIVSNSVGQWLWANQSACALLGYDLTNLVPVAPTRFTSAEDVSKQNDLIVTTAAAGKTTFSFHKGIQRQSGEWIGVDVQVTLHAQDDQIYCLELWQPLAAPPQGDPQSQSVDELQRQLQSLQAELDYQVGVRNAMLLKAYHFEALSRLITEELRNSLDERKVLQAAVEELTLGLDLDTCGITLLQEGSDQITVYEYPISLPPTTQRPDYFIFSNSQRVRTEVPTEPRLLSSWYAPGITVVVSSHPIMDEDKRWGWLWMVRRADPHPRQEHKGIISFSESEVRLGLQISGQCAIAIRQSRLHQVMEVQLQELQRLNRLKDDFLNAVSLELGSPLTNMQLALKMIRTYAGSWELQERYLSIVEEECRREIALVSDLLDIRRLARQVMPDHWEMVMVAAWLETLLHPYRLQAEAQQQGFHLHIDPQVQRFYTDPGLLSQVLRELLHNACRYTPSQHTIEVRVEIVPFPAGEGLKVVVSNDGVDVAPEDLDHFFEPFFRRPVPHGQGDAGAGLGLALAKAAVVALGGNIGVNQVQQRLVFTIQLPPHPLAATAPFPTDP